MRSVSGLDRPAIQWTFVICGVALIAISTWTGVALVRARRSLEEARAVAQQATRDREQTEASLVRERAARESYMLQLGRERHAAGSATNPILTLTPLKTRSSRGPELAVPSTAAPVVELHLLLPPRTPLDRRFAITLRSWTSGEMLWSRASLRPGEVSGKHAVITNLGSDVLTTGSYELLLTTGTPPTDIAVYEVSIIPPSAPR